jgi:hypothetical protein
MGIVLLATQHCHLLMKGHHVDHPKRKRIFSNSALVGGLFVACVLMGVAVAVFVLGGSSADSAASALTKDETQQITASIDVYFGLDDISWPPSEYAAALPSDFCEKAKAHAVQTLADVATVSLQTESANSVSMAAFLNEYRAARDVLIVKTEHRIRNAQFLGFTQDGDVTFRVDVWYGETRGSWDSERGELARVFHVDATPTYDVTLTQQSGTWKIDKVHQVQISEDASPQEYGPDTPHTQASAGI